VYQCPTMGTVNLQNEYATTHYAGNSGTIPGQDDGVLYPLSSLSLRHLLDGTSSTLVVGEVAFELGGWAQGAMNTGGGGQGFARAVLRWWRAAPTCSIPGLNPPQTNCSNSIERRFQFSSRHPGGVQFIFADGSTRFISANLNTTVLRSLMTRQGGEAIGDF
jgi:prepilin-type processing-associated H-X9-DG protein